MTLPWERMLVAAGVGQLALVAASLAIPRALRWPEDLARLRPLTRQVFWTYAGYNMLILYAALQAVSPEIYESARIDGCSGFRLAWSIKIPAIRQAIILTIIFSIIGSFQLFNEPNLLFNIAPNSIGTDFTPNLYAYNLAFRSQEINYAAAIAFLLGVVIMIVSFVVQTLTNRKERQS